MYPSANGKMFFNNFNEMFYELFMEIGLAINNEQYVYDQDTGIILKFKDKRIKMSFTSDVYAGNNDIIFDPSTNYDLMVKLFGYIKPRIQSFKFPKDERFKQRVVVRTRNGDICSNYYYNLYLAYIEIIFIISENPQYDLSNFDILPEV